MSAKSNITEKFPYIVIEGPIGSGKTTLARGQGTDDAALRKTERFPILSPEDIQKATEVIVLSSSVGKDKLDSLFSATDRTYTLSSTTKSEKEKILGIDSSTVQIYEPSNKSKTKVDTEKEQKIIEDKISKIKEEILSGEVFQVVLSQRFELSCTANSIDIYRMLRLKNPSPYMYFLRFGDGVDIIGSSPEALVKVKNREVMVHPIAGTRKRSDNPEQDEKLAQELLSDPKERAEHLMLVDLGRNDLGRVCESGTVEVVQFMNIEKYSHVMHIVSTVEADLAAGQTAFDLLAATFPAGTLSGAPKPRAMEIIEELEGARRGRYGGVVG